MSVQSNVFYIPDTLRNWPWPRSINPNYEVCKAESSAWCESFNAFSPKAQKAFNACDFSQCFLPSLSEIVADIDTQICLLRWPFPVLTRVGTFSPCHSTLLRSLTDGCRIGCDLMNLFFVIDEYSDVASGDGAREQANIVMDALRNPYKPRPAGEWVGGEVARQSVFSFRTALDDRRTFADFGRTPSEQLLRPPNIVSSTSSIFTWTRSFSKHSIVTNISFGTSRATSLSVGTRLVQNRLSPSTRFIST
jgi:hypothetical protein